MFISSTIVLILAVICSFWLFRNPLSIYTYKKLCFNLDFIKRLLNTSIQSRVVWMPLFKRSSYIGLVWKTNYKL